MGIRSSMARARAPWARCAYRKTCLACLGSCTGSLVGIKLPKCVVLQHTHTRVALRQLAWPQLAPSHAHPRASGALLWRHEPPTAVRLEASPFCLSGWPSDRRQRRAPRRRRPEGTGGGVRRRDALRRALGSGRGVMRSGAPRAADAEYRAARPLLGTRASNNALRASEAGCGQRRRQFTAALQL